MNIWCKYADEQIMTNTLYDYRDKNNISLHSGRNMPVFCQVALRHTENFSIEKIGCIELSDEIKFDYNFIECIMFNDGVPYPDILSKKRSKDVLKNYTQSVLLSFNVSKNADVKNNKIKVCFFTNVGEFFVVVNLKIYSVQLVAPAEGALKHEYFLFNLTKYFTYKGKEQITIKNWDNTYRYEVLSEDWWHLMEECAKSLKFLRVNRLWLPLSLLLAYAGSSRTGEKTWNFNYKYVDKFVDVFLKNGSFSSIIIEHLISAVDGTSIDIIDENSRLKNTLTSDETYLVYLEELYKSVYRHFKEKGWQNLLVMHIQDEPHFSDKWIKTRELITKCMPDIKCGEPLDMHESCISLEKYMDFFIPRIDVYERNIEYYNNLKENGKEMWVYSCCYPEEGWWLNKFINYGAIRSRQIEWACFSQDIVGFLHWGFAYWVGDLYGIDVNARFKGDGFIVYPDGENNSIIMSMRGVGTNEGSIDYELLTLLAEKDKNLAKTFSKKVAESFTKFNKDNRSAEKARAKILQLLESSN